ncbi:MAG: RDD family protein [Syntrophomonadaceae bacterium]
MAEPGPAEPLRDFPLRPEPPLEDPRLFPAEPEPSEGPRPAPLGPRFFAAAADAAAVLLLAAIAILAARLLTGRSPRGAGLAWAAAFLVYLSLFAIVPPLVLFGRTIGMALADLSVESGGPGAGLPPSEALRRWTGSLATAATGGLLLLWSRRHPELPTPADRLSGRPLALE